VVLFSFTWAIFPDRDLDALRSKTLAQVRALDNAWKALCGIDGEDFGEASREHGGFASVDSSHGDGIATGVCRGWGAWDAYVDKGEAKSGWFVNWMGLVKKRGRERT
jgi:hypothetical protein